MRLPVTPWNLSPMMTAALTVLAPGKTCPKPRTAA